MLFGVSEGGVLPAVEVIFIWLSNEFPCTEEPPVEICLQPVLLVDAILEPRVMGVVG